MKSLKLVFPILLILTTLTSCSIRSSQFSSLVDMFQDPSDPLYAHSWTVRYGEYSAILYAVSMPDGVLFSNEYGDRFLFDGWVIREASGLGVSRADWKIVDSKNNRQFFNGNRLVGEHMCSAWVLDEQAGMKRFNQNCSSFSLHKNYILVNDNAEITLIRQVVDGRNNFITLSKNF
jgi:hypothetical protein